MNSLINQLHERHPHLNDNQFKAEFIANQFPNRYAFNKYLTNVWEGKTLNDHEIRIARYGVEKATRLLALRLCILLENTSIKVREKDKLVELLKALSDGK